METPTMLRHLSFILLTCFLFPQSFLFATRLPGLMAPAELEKTIRVIGYGSTSRVMRSAESYNLWPGMKFGFELPFVNSNGLADDGDGKGTVPGIVFSPRLYIAKGLLDNFEMILNFFKEDMVATPGTFGAIFKYTYHSETTEWASMAAFVGLTSVSAYHGSILGGGGYNGKNIEVGTYLSKDYVRFKPYGGLGVLFAEGTVAQMNAKENVSDWEGTVHLFAGIEFIWPVNLTLQIDFMNLTAMGSLMFGYVF